MPGWAAPPAPSRDRSESPRRCLSRSWSRGSGPQNSSCLAQPRCPTEHPIKKLDGRPLRRIEPKRIVLGKSPNGDGALVLLVSRHHGKEVWLGPLVHRVAEEPREIGGRPVRRGFVTKSQFQHGVTRCLGIRPSPAAFVIDLTQIEVNCSPVLGANLSGGLSQCTGKRIWVGDPASDGQRRRGRILVRRYRVRPNPIVTHLLPSREGRVHRDYLLDDSRLMRRVKVSPDGSFNQGGSTHAMNSTFPRDSAPITW